jgi:hypothetical protein
VDLEIVDRIKNRAIEPQAVVALVTQNSSLITVIGEVNGSTKCNNKDAVFAADARAALTMSPISNDLLPNGDTDVARSLFTGRCGVHIAGIGTDANAKMQELAPHRESADRLKSRALRISSTLLPPLSDPDYESQAMQRKYSKPEWLHQVRSILADKILH